MSVKDAILEILETESNDLTSDRSSLIFKLFPELGGLAAGERERTELGGLAAGERERIELGGLAAGERERERERGAPFKSGLDGRPSFSGGDKKFPVFK